MLFRDAKIKIQQASMTDFLVRRIFETRRYIERGSGRLISDEDFYAALAVAMMESKDHHIKRLRDHLAICPLAIGILADNNINKIVDTFRPPSKLHPLVQQDKRDQKAVGKTDER